MVPSVFWYSMLTLRSVFQNKDSLEASHKMFALTSWININWCIREVQIRWNKHIELIFGHLLRRMLFKIAHCCGDVSLGNYIMIAFLNLILLFSQKHLYYVQQLIGQMLQYTPKYQDLLQIKFTNSQWCQFTTYKLHFSNGRICENYSLHGFICVVCRCPMWRRVRSSHWDLLWESHPAKTRQLCVLPVQGLWSSAAALLWWGP